MHDLEDGILEDSEIYFLLPSDFAEKHLFSLQHLGVFHCDSRYRATHAYWESILLFFIDEGTLHVSCRGQQFTGSPGDVVILDCRYEHFYYSIGDLRFRYFHFTGLHAAAYADLLWELNGGSLIKGADSPVLRHTFKNLLSIAQTAVTSRNEHRVSTWIQMILTELVEFSHGEISAKGDEQISLSIVYMKEHLSDNLSLDELADQAGLSKNHYGRLFKRSTGTTPHQYFNSLRLQHAESLLTTSYATIEEIADRCGFDSASNFIRLFKKHTGMTPSAFRQIPF